MKEKDKGRIKGSISAALFLILVFVVSVIHIKEAKDLAAGDLTQVLLGKMPIAAVPSVFEEEYNQCFSKKEISLDLFSAVQRAIGKHEARDFEVVRANDGTLYLQGSDEPVDREFIEKIADEYKMIRAAVEEYGGKFLFVQYPEKNENRPEELRYYLKDNSAEKENCLIQAMKDRGIPVLDLRDYDECRSMYKTDHHWTSESAFRASSLIAGEIKRLFSAELPGPDVYGTMDNYEAVTYKNCFLGSIGIKVGPYFTGRDDFTVYIPRFDTSLAFRHFIGGEADAEYAGDFRQTFIDEKLLENREYNNKYDANMHGAYCESIIENRLAENDRTGLLITHSFGRSMGQYLSLYFKELRYLDPQRGRYNGNYIEYVKSYRPDIVILMYDDLINVGDGAWEP